MDRRIVFAFIIFIIVLLLAREWESDTESRRRSGLSTTTGNLAQFDRVELEPPSHMPFYSVIDRGGIKRMVVDFTPVPNNQAAVIKPTENPKNYVIDRKFTYFGKDGRVVPTALPENLTEIDIKLAAVMAGKTEEEIRAMWEKLTPEEIGRMIETTKETTSTLRQELVNQDLTDKQIGTQYAAEEKFIKTLPIGFDCLNVRDDCDKWREDNDCLINPTFMLSNCAKSCGSCLLSPEQKARLSEIYEAREPPNCVFHEGYIAADYEGIYT
jgi:ShK domain-like